VSVSVLVLAIKSLTISCKDYTSRGFNGRDPYAYKAFKLAWIYADKQMTAFKYTEHQKVQNLHKVLTGEAFGLIKGLAVTDESYAQAWETLDSRYNNPVLQYTPLLESIFHEGNMGFSRQATMDMLTKVTNVIHSRQALNLVRDWGEVQTMYGIAGQFNDTLSEQWKKLVYKKKSSTDPKGHTATLEDMQDILQKDLMTWDNQSRG
jgi:hypothetical protein